MYKTAKELLNSEIDYDIKKQIYYSINNGLEIYKEIIGKNIDVFGMDLSSNVLPRVMSFCIDAQFSPELYVTKNGFESSIRKVNVFNYKVVELTNSNLILHIAKVRKNKLIPNASKYKLEYAANNNFGYGQLKLDLDEKNKSKVQNMPYYGFVSYTIGKSYQIEEINLVIPDTNMKNYLSKINIKEEVEKLKTIENDKENEKTLVTLKELVKKERKSI